MFSHTKPCSQWSYSRCQRHSWHKRKSHLVQLINLPLLIEAVLLSFVGRIVLTNIRLVFHGLYIHLNPPCAKTLVLLRSSSHPVMLQIDNTTHVLRIVFSHDQARGIYLHDIAEVQDRQCPESGCCMASCAHVVSEAQELYDHTPVPRFYIPKTEGTKIRKQRK